MPVILIDRIPLPSLQTYTAFSVLILSCSLYYAAQVTSQPGWKANVTVTSPNPAEEIAGEGEISLLPPVLEVAADGGNSTEGGGFSLTEVVYYMIDEPLCIWTLINAAYCCLILLGKAIQRVVFGELRVSERQHMKDKFWNFVFYKFIFIFGVINVQYMDEVLLWCSWFSILGFLHLLAQLSRDRFEYLSFSPTTPKWTHVRLISLLVAIMATSTVLFGICVMVGFQVGLYMFAFMGAECVLLNLRTLFVLVRYVIHLLDMNHEGVWENRGIYTYYTELIFEMAAFTVDLMHQIHMLLWGNIFLSMASLVICMQIRYLFYEIQRRFKKHKNYLNVVHHLEKNYPEGTADDLAANSDDCAICWDKMETARKLPCGHLFHKSCLRSWLEQDTSCPTCRTSLATLNRQPAHASPENTGVNTLLLPGPLAGPPNHPPEAGQNRATTNHFFHFDGSRYVSWLPSFSVEVTHTQLLMERQQHIQTSQLDSMARQVQQLFPNIPLVTILGDLQLTRSIEVTIENILDERLVAPPFQLQATRVPNAAGGDSNLPEGPSGSPVSPAAQNEGGSGVGDVFVASSEVDTCATASASTQEEVMTTIDEVESVEPPVTIRNETSKSSLMHQEVGGFGNGGRFSKSPQERERMLAQRKEELIRHTKRKYLASKYYLSDATTTSVVGGDVADQEEIEGESSASLENKRYLAYQAAQRRLRQMHDDL